MKCPKCEFENSKENKFCRKCGAKLLLACPKCGVEHLPGDHFCGECGCKLTGEEPEPGASVTEAERKQTTVLFSDMSAFTAITEKVDPEDLKEMMSRIFGEIAQVVAKYGGVIDKFIGDAVMAIFGVPQAHEDDAVRAILAAQETHSLVAALSPSIEAKTGQPLGMHTGISTGLVVTGQTETDKGLIGFTGDTINLAARLSGVAKDGEVLVDPATYTLSRGYFDFEESAPARVKGKVEPVKICKVLSAKEAPDTIHRLYGIRAELIGRKAEMNQLQELVDNLRQGQGSIVSFIGDAGTGKSRLIEEFKTILDLDKIQWSEGHAYAFCQNIPYYPLINLLNRIFRIEEGDPPEDVREKIEAVLRSLIGECEEIIPYIGSLYSLSYPEIDEVNPELWKDKLHDAVHAIISGMTRLGPTIVYFEDLHWADPSTVELLRKILANFRNAVLFLCVYRPTFSLFPSHQISTLSKPYHEITLHDLSPSETQDMVGSLLQTQSVEAGLLRFVQDRVEGNPFYLEEVINSLIEMGTLVRKNGDWKFTRPLGESVLPSTIQGVIAARLDNLEREAKRVLQEASVIGRVFVYELLKRITDFRDRADRCLLGLERLDLIRTQSLEPDLEYIFKHALTQGVVYNGLLKKDRQVLHERIGLVMEELFQDRLPEFYETLAFHFKHGRSFQKAVNYLMKSGEKNMSRYAVEESHLYFQEAFDLFSKKPDISKEEKSLLIDLLNKWAHVFYYRGDYKTLTELLSAYQHMAESLDDKARMGMFYVWLGFAYWGGAKYKDSYQYLNRALALGEELEDQQIIGYACNWLTFTCLCSGHLDEGIIFGERAVAIARHIPSDQFLNLKPLSGLGLIYGFRGEAIKAFKIGKELLDYGRSKSNVRSLVMGHIVSGVAYVADGDFPSAVQCGKNGVQVSADPYYSSIARLYLGLFYTNNCEFQEAKEILNTFLTFSEKFGDKNHKILLTYLCLGPCLIDSGQMGQGLKILEEGLRICLESGARSGTVFFENMLGKIYLKITEGASPIALSTMAKNIGFLTKNVPFASKKAENHLQKAIEASKEIGMKGTLGTAHLDMGLLHKAKGRKDKARACLNEAAMIFEDLMAKNHLRQTQEILSSLK